MGRTDIGKDITRGSLWPDLNNKTLHVVAAVTYLEKEVCDVLTGKRSFRWEESLKLL